MRAADPAFLQGRVFRPAHPAGAGAATLARILWLQGMPDQAMATEADFYSIGSSTSGA
jgi:hypothetical protein